MLQYSDIRRRRHKFYWVLSLGFAYFIFKGIWNSLVFIFKKIHRMTALLLNKISNVMEKAERK
tara:strand:+ start:179 stop:367 length:189 start_codon:yes stop_codon:yes gene_type:complete